MGQDLALHVLEQELALRIVARETKGHLRQVVGAKGKELGVLGQFARRDGPSRRFNHRAELVVDLHALFGHHFLGHAFQHFALEPQLVDVGHQRDHHLDVHAGPLLRLAAARLEDCPGLHLGNPWHHQPHAASAQTHHGIRFPQRFDHLEQVLLLRQQLGIRPGAAQPSDLLYQLLSGGEELVHRRIDQADNDGQAVHCLKDALKVGALEGEQSVQILLPLLVALGHDHANDDRPPFLLKEHMLRAAQPDPLGAKGPGLLGIAWIVSVGVHAKAAEFIGPAEQR